MISVNDIKATINEIQHHFDKNINNKYVKNIIHKLDLPPSVSQDFNNLLTSDMIYLDSRGAIEDLYNGIKSVIVFMQEVIAKVIPNISSYSNPEMMSAKVLNNDNEKILYQMAIKNYPMNIKILDDLITKLYSQAVVYDNTNFTKDPAFKKVKDYTKIETDLIEIKNNLTEKD